MQHTHTSTVRRYWNMTVFGFIAGCLLVIAGQFFYPANRLLPFSEIDGTHVGSETKENVIQQLDSAYKDKQVRLFFGQSTRPEVEPKTTELGITITNVARVERLSYPWYIRLIPGSLFWYNRTQTVMGPSYYRDNAVLQQYLTNRFGDDCTIETENDNPIGTCSRTEIASKLFTKNISLTTSNDIHLGLTEMDSSQQTAGTDNSNLSQLLASFAANHPGTYGVQYIELTGKQQQASYNADKQFMTASTYKLFVAYGALQKIEAGQWHWSDQVSAGRDLTKCFDDMIVKSDNACAEAMLNRYGQANLTAAIHKLGLTHSFFRSDSPYSTPADEALFLTLLANNQILSQQSSRDTMLAAMKRQVYREGIPSGTSSVVADKVGFLYALLHDAAIVYAPHDTYVLVIMTDDSTWSNIAELTKQIETFRAQQ